MNTTSCRACGTPVDADALTCPECGAPRPARAEWHGEGYEWKSELTWMGSPLAHIAFGIDREGKVRTARGIVAIGQRAVGVIACGVIA
ncbi:MAG: zinc-ribbon domain-containing protein, partial [Verrucomicrobiota bacterium]